MKKISFVLIIFVVCCGNAFAQTAPAPVITNTLPPEKAKKKAFNPADLTGLKGQIAPQFVLPAMNGTGCNLENLRGKIVVINLWGTFCSPCITEIPELNALVRKYNEKGIVFLAPAPDDKAALEIFLKKHPFDYQILPNGFAVIEKYAPHKKSDEPDKIGGFMMVLPTHLVIDQTGTVTYHNWGYSKTTAAELTKEIDNLLAKKK